MMDRSADNLASPPATDGNAPVPSLYALMGEFEDVDSLLAAAEKVRDAGYRDWDVHAPFPVHGIDKAMGMRPTILPWLSLGAGLAGVAGGTFLVWWINATSTAALPATLSGYQYLISGKPIFSLPANIPIIFELTVLITSIVTFLGMLALNRLPMLYHPLFKSARFRRVTDDRFFVVIEASDPQFDEPKTRALLEGLGSTAVERIED